MEKIYIACDHGGFQLKEHLIKFLKKSYEIIDLGTDNEKGVDYPDFGKKLAKAVLKEKTRGIGICGTGIGISITLNRFKGIRAALCHDEYTAKMAREHNNANVLCMGGRIVGVEEAEKIVDVWLSTDYSGEDRHTRRNNKVDE